MSFPLILNNHAMSYKEFSICIVEFCFFIIALTLDNLSCELSPAYLTSNKNAFSSDIDGLSSHIASIKSYS